MNRFAHGILAVALLLGASCATPPATGPGRVDSNSNWLLYCSEDADCGDLSCQCGVCTLPCVDDGCTVLGPTAHCAPASDVENLGARCGEAEPSHRLCVATCAGDDDCGAGRQCLLDTCIEALPVRDDGGTEQPAADACYLACRVVANEDAQLCIDVADTTPNACVAAATAALEACAAGCDDPSDDDVHVGDDPRTGAGDALGTGASDGESDTAAAPLAACAGWVSTALALAPDSVGADALAQPEIDTERPSERFVRYSDAFGLWVGLVRYPEGYRFYLSPARDGLFLPATDFAGHGQDFCELIDPGFKLPAEDDITSGGCSACSIGTNMSLVDMEVYARGALGERFVRTMASSWGGHQTAVVDCGIGPVECRALGYGAAGQ